VEVEVKATITLSSTDDEIQVVRAGTGGHHSLVVSLDADGSILIRTENDVVVPGLGELPEELLMDEHPGPIRVRWPLYHEGPESEQDHMDEPEAAAGPPEGAAGPGGTPLYVREFPEFAGVAMPDLPGDFHDVSDRNDACPTFESTARLCLVAVRHSNPAKREPGCGGYRYTLTVWSSAHHMEHRSPDDGPERSQSRHFDTNADLLADLPATAEELQRAAREGPVPGQP
jgi:hypothetical protein